MSFWFGLLIGWIAGIAFTIWCDRQPHNACLKGGFHFWEKYLDAENTYTTSRFCSKCGIDEESNWWGQRIQ